MALTQVKTGGIENDAVTEDKVANDAISPAEMKAGTDGHIITYDASGNPTTIGPGNDGQVLTSTGTGSPPAFEDLPASGVTVSNNSNNRVVTGDGTNLNAEANLTFDGSTLDVTGLTDTDTLNVSSTSTFIGDMSIDGSLMHNGDTNTLIKFPAADTISAETGGTERIRIDSSGRTLFKCDSTGGNSGLGGFGTHGWEPKVQVLHNQGAVSIRDGDSEWGGAIHIAKCRGTYASPTTSADDDRAGGVYYSAHDGTDFQNYVAGIEAFVDDTVASNDTPGRLVFSTAADGANTLSERLRIDKDGMSKFTRGSGGTVGHFYANARESNILIQNDARTWKIVNYDYGDNGTDHLGFHDGSHDRMIIQNDGDVKIGTGDLIFGGAGKGICLGVTSNTDENTLDDYEEGTFTPTLITGNNGYRFQRGSYVKVGQMVHVTAFIEVSAACSSGNLGISGLPFTSSTIDSNNHVTIIGPTWSNRCSLGDNALWYLAANSQTAYCYAVDSSASNGTTLLDVNNLSQANASSIMLSGTYRTT